MTYQTKGWLLKSIPVPQICMWLWEGGAVFTEVYGFPAVDTTLVKAFHLKPWNPILKVQTPTLGVEVIPFLYSMYLLRPDLPVNA